MADIRDNDLLFAATGGLTNVGTSETNVVLFRNPSGSTRTVRIKRFVFTNTRDVSSFVRIRVYVGPTVTGTGTLQTSVALDVGGGASAQGEFRLSPTTSANGTQILDYMAPGNVSGFSQIHDAFDGFQLRPNTALLFTASADGTNREPRISIMWEES